MRRMTLALALLAVGALALPPWADAGPAAKAAANSSRDVTLVDLERPAAHQGRSDCGTSYYYDDTATSVYVWSIPNGFGDDLFNTRFTVAGNSCTLMVSRILLYGPYMTGEPDMRVYVWDDDGMGFPGNVLDSVTIPNANLPTSGFGWATADWATTGTLLEFDSGEEYHIGWTTLGGDGDTLWCVSDKDTGPYSGDSRCSAHFGGNWISMLDLYGADFVFFTETDACCEDSPQFSGISFAQVDMVLGDSVVTDTDWGRIGVDEDILSSSTGLEFGYLNGYTDTGWVIQNLIIDASIGAHEACTYFDLGIDVGQTVDIMSVHLSYTEDPLASFSDGPRTYLSVSSIYYSTGGVGDSVTWETPAPPKRVVYDRKGITTYHRQMDANVQCAAMQCVPCCVANNVQFLEDTYPFIDAPHNHVPGLRPDNSLVGQHGLLMNRTANSRTSGDGVWFVPWIRGKLQYLADNALSDRLAHHHQGYGYTNTLPVGNYTHAGITSVDETDPVLYIDFDWIDACVQRGEAVELCENSHAVRINASGRTLGQPWVRILHDARQTDIDPADNQGLENAQFTVVRDGTSNRLRLGGSPWMWVSYVMASAPPADEVMIRDCPDDVGNEPDVECGNDMVRSPDVWIDNNFDNIINIPQPGFVNRIYFRAQNIGLNTQTGVTLNASYVDPSMGLYFPNPNGTDIVDIVDLQSTRTYGPIVSGGDARLYIRWLIPNPPPHIHHYCIGAVLNQSHGPDQQFSPYPREDNNVAQINMWALYQKAGTVAPKTLGGKGLSPNQQDSTVFRSVVKGCNTLGQTEHFEAWFDSTDLAQLPWGWVPRIEGEGTWPIDPDSCVEIDVYVTVHEPVHNDSVDLTVLFGPLGGNGEVTGAISLAYCIDNHAADSMNELTATIVNDVPGRQAAVRLDWYAPREDSIGQTERIRFFRIYSDSTPGVDYTDILDSVAIDADSIPPGYQWYDERPITALKRYYRITSVDGAYNESPLSNEASVSFSCCVLRGDVNRNGTGPDIADLVYLVSFMFSGGPAPPCLEEADINGDGSLLPDITDLVYLVSYMFSGGPPPVPCP